VPNSRSFRGAVENQVTVQYRASDGRIT